MCGCGGRAISSKKQNAGVADEPFPQKTKCRCGGTADALVSGSSEEIRVGSNPVTCTNKKSTTLAVVPFLFIRMVGFEEER